MRLKCGPKRQTNFLDLIEKIPVKGEMLLDNDNQRNRALKFARENRRMFVTRAYKGKILLWRAS
jgi:hypothetical protein